MKKLLGTIFSVAILFIFFCNDIQVEAKAEDTILKGIYIDGIDVSGMTATEAKTAVNEMVKERLSTAITLKCVDDNEVVITPAELGMKWSNPEIINEVVKLGRVGNVIDRYKLKKDLERENYVVNTSYSYDKELIKQLVEEKCMDFNQEAVDMRLQRKDGEFIIIEGQKGKTIDSASAVSAIYEYVVYEWDGTEGSLALPVKIEEPKGTEAELSKVKDVLGSYTTTYKSSASARVANVENGTRLLNGVTLYPGETFSTLELVTPFSEANGYKMAGSYLNGLVVDSLGGGICQVSTTLYNAVLRAELEVSQRSSHSMSVSYVPLSADAAIAESAGKDFCFTNNTDFPIYIEGITTPDRQVTFNIYGVETRSAGHSVDYVTEVLETIQPDTENIIQVADQPIGYTKIQSVHVGYKARLIKVVYENGVEKQREVVNNSTYKMVPRTVSVGVATDNPEAYNQIQAAIATGNIDHVCAIAGAIAAQNAPAPAANAIPEVNAAPAANMAPEANAAPAAGNAEIPVISTEIVPEI